MASIVLAVFFLQRAQSDNDRTTSSAAAPPAVAARPTPPRTDGRIMLAVPPLPNYSGDPQQDYFADGMTEALIADLAQLEGLRVISRTSVMRYRAQDKPLPQVASELGADMIVEGSVVRDGDRVRVTAQLIQADSDHHLWARSYEKQMKDVLSLQGEVAAAITRGICERRRGSMPRSQISNRLSRAIRILRSPTPGCPTFTCCRTRALRSPCG